MHIKLGLLKKFVKAMDRESRSFTFLQKKFRRVSLEQLKANIFDGPQLRELMKAFTFDEVLNAAELSVWGSFKSVIAKFLENNKCKEYERKLTSP